MDLEDRVKILESYVLPRIKEEQRVLLEDKDKKEKMVHRIGSVTIMYIAIDEDNCLDKYAHITLYFKSYSGFYYPLTIRYDLSDHVSVSGKFLYSNIDMIIPETSLELFIHKSKDPSEGIERIVKMKNLTLPKRFIKQEIHLGIKITLLEEGCDVEFFEI